MLPRILTVTIVTLQVGACASLSASDPALYQGLAESDANLTSRLIQTTLESTPDEAPRRCTNQQTGNSGETYVSENGYFCRDYREELAVARRLRALLSHRLPGRFGSLGLALSPRVLLDRGTSDFRELDL